MLLASTALACGGAAPSMATTPDAVATDPDKYHLVLENDSVRVLDYRDPPGAKTSMHHHAAFVLHAFGPFDRRLWFPDGTSRVVSFQGGESVFMPAQTHAAESHWCD